MEKFLNLDPDVLIYHKVLDKIYNKIIITESSILLLNEKIVTKFLFLDDFDFSVLELYKKIT